MRNPSVQHWLVEYYNSPRDSNSCSIVYFHEFIISRAVRSDSVSGRLRRLLRTLQWNLCPYKTVAVQTSTDYCHLDIGLVCYHQDNVLNIRNIWSDGSFYYIYNNNKTSWSQEMFHRHSMVRYLYIILFLLYVLLFLYFV